MTEFKEDLLSEIDLTFDNALTLAQAMESANKNLQDLQLQERNVNAVKSSVPGRAGQRSEPRPRVGEGSQGVLSLRRQTLAYRLSISKFKKPCAWNN